MSKDSDRLRELLAQLGMNQTQCARVLNLSVREFRRMCAAGRPVPKAVMLAVEGLLREREGR